MDLDTLIPLLLVLLYLVAQVLDMRRKRGRQQPGGDGPGPVPLPEEREVDPSLDDALREIRQALGYPEPEPEPEPEPDGMLGQPVERPLEPAKMPERPSTKMTRIPASSPVTSSIPAPPRRGLDALPTPGGLDERMPRRMPDEQEKPVKDAYALIERTRRVELSARSLRKHLADPAAAREAILMREILGPPKGMEP